MMPSPTEITYFLELYQIRHVSKAAMRLGVTQPTLTQSLQKLEDKVGAKLFHRTKQGLIPTTNAGLFYGRAKQLMDYWSEVSSGVAANENEIAGQFTVGCHPSVGAYCLPKLFDRLRSDAPGIQLSLRHDFSRKVTEQVVSYEVDLGYVVNPPRNPDLVLKKMGDDRVTFWKKKGAAQPPKVIFADSTRVQIEDLLGKTYRKYFQGWQLVASTNLELIRGLTEKGLGIGILPERVAFADRDDHLVLYDRDLPSRPDEIYLAYRRDAMGSRAAKELLRLASFEL